MKINHLLILVLLLSACGKPTLDYDSQEYLEAVEQFEKENYDSTQIILLQVSNEYQLPDTALNYLALTYHILDKRDSAIYYWEQAVTQNPDFELGYYNLGLMYDYQENQESALENYDKAIRIDPNSKKALYNKASILFQQGKYPESLNLGKRAIASDSTYILPINLLGRIYLEQNKPDSALIYFQQLVQMDSSNAEYHFYLARSESEIGNFKEALKHYNESYKLDPSANHVLFNRATLFQENSQYENAKNDYWTLLGQDSTDVECYIRLSWIYSNQNKLDSMKLVLENSIKIDPNYSNAYLYLGDYYSRINKKSKACELYQKASELNNQRAAERLANGCNNENEKSS